MLDKRSGKAVIALACALLATAFVAGGTVQSIVSPDQAVRSEFRGMIADNGLGWGDDGQATLKPAFATDRDAHLWLGSHDRTDTLEAGSFRIGGRVLVRGGDGMLAALVVRAVTPLHDAGIAAGRSLLMIELHSESKPAAAPVRMLIEAGNRDWPPARPRALGSPRTL